MQLLRERSAARCAQYDGWACVTQDARTLFTQRRARKPKPTPTPTVAPTPAPPALVSVTFGPSVTVAQLDAALADNSLDEILLTAGTYTLASELTINAGRTRPVTMRPASGSVTFDGNSVAGVQKVFAVFDAAAYTTFKGFTVTDYGPLGTGTIVLLNGAHHITFDALTMTGNRMTSANDHLIYPAGYAAACYNIVIINSTLNGAGGGAVHVYHAPGAYNVTVQNNTITNNVWGIIAAVTGGQVTATGNTFSGNTTNMIAYGGSTITASGNIPSDYVDPN